MSDNVSSVNLEEKMGKVLREEDNYSKFYDQVYGRDNPKGKASGWIQWKGTDVCIDLVCECGERNHFDGDFFYFYQCQKCLRIYAVGQNIKLIKLSAEEIKLGDLENWQYKVGQD